MRFGEPVICLECPCCGDTGAVADAKGMFYDGQALLCGCAGCVSCDAETEPYVQIGEDECPEGALCHGGSG